MIKVENLTKRFGDVTAVDRISFEVQKGEILGFLGPNGAGKTTTMRMLTCYMPATEGTASVMAYDIFKDSMKVRRRIGYLPENPPLYQDLTVESYLIFMAKIRQVPKKQISERIEITASQCGISDVLGRVIRHLSKGYKQRVGLAQALIHEPKVLILDEPTIGLDPKQIIEIRKLIKGLGGKHTIILSTHILPEVTMTCDRVVIIHQGKIVAADTMENLARHLGGRGQIYIRLDEPDQDVVETIGHLRGVNKVEPEEETEGAYIVSVEEGANVALALSRLAADQQWGLLELKPQQLSLEEIFIQLTSR